MFRGRFLGFLFVALLAVGLLGLAGSSIYRAGWTQGYFIGKVADGAAAGGTTVIAPQAAPEAAPEAAPGQIPHYSRGFSPAGSFFGTVFKCLLMLFLFGLFFKFIGLLMWRKGGHRGWHANHKHHGRWHHKGHWGQGRWGQHHDGSPPWYDDDADEPMKA